MGQAYIEIKNVSKKIKNDMVLSNINLRLEEGKVYGFRGKNGSGKTMLFRSISGLIKPTEGEIIINDEVLGKDISFPRDMGILIEHPGFLPNLTGFKNLKYLADIKKIIGDEEIKSAIKLVGLDPNDKRAFKKYSLGMKQRLGIAQAIMENPKILILDEPTNALDVEGVDEINKIILSFKEKGAIVLLANHEKDELEKVADEIFFMDCGKLKAE